MTRAFPTQTNKKVNPLATKLWEFRNVLRDSGLSTAEFVEQLTYLIFLKMADEITARPVTETKKRAAIVPAGYDWNSLTEKTGSELGDHYRVVLAEHAKKDPATTVGTLFAGSQNRIPNGDLLRKLIVDLIDAVDWKRRAIDLMGDAFEVLLARSAEDTKTGAGQYFTPRPLVKAIIDVVQPRPTDTITDPACGTGGFLIAAHHYIREHHHELSPQEFRALVSGRIWGQELVPNTVRLAVMNMLLHGLGSAVGQSLVVTGDALLTQPSRHASLVLTHPPFGKMSAITAVGRNSVGEKEDVRYPRNDFMITTANKQINFLQHVMSSMEMNGRAAVIVPDNVLFETGTCVKLRRRLLDDFDLHTILRLPTGIFYAGGVKANVLFFDKRPRIAGKSNTSRLWVYDLRTGMQFSLKQKPLQQADLAEFVEAYLPGRSHTDRIKTERFRCFSYAELIARDHLNLDIAWTDDSALDDTHTAPPPGVIAREIIENLEAALTQFASVAEELGGEPLPQTDMQE